jgi:hypothetical protein
LTRVVLGMAVADWISAATGIMASYLQPVNEESPVHKFDRGNWTTCQASGFLSFFALSASVVYNGCVGLCYLLTIRYGWRDTQLRKWQPLLHGLPLCYRLTTATAALTLDLFNPTATGCTIQEYPQGCSSSSTPCLRGAHASRFRLMFHWGLVWSVFLFLCVSMGLIYRHMFRTSRRSVAYTFGGGVAAVAASRSGSDVLRSRFVTQSVLYNGTFL